MRVEDIVYLILARAIPGRSLENVQLGQYAHETAAESAGVITVNLATPTRGFLRQWDMIQATLSAPADTNFVLLKMSSGGQAVIPIRIVLKTGFLPSYAIPIVGCTTTDFGTVVANAEFVSLRGVDPLICGHEDLCQVRAGVVPASGQTLTVDGRYFDIPI